MTLLRCVVVLGFVVSGCADIEPSPLENGRFSAEAEGFSCQPPSDWIVARDRGAVMFTSGTNSRRTIAIRSVPLASKSGTSAVLADTQRVLRSLPGVDLEAGRDVEGAMPATEFRMTFAPPNTSERYARRHIVVRGTRHVFHVIETSPSSSTTDDTVLQLVSSIREEA